jgi:hypothetical protein
VRTSPETRPIASRRSRLVSWQSSAPASATAIAERHREGASRRLARFAGERPRLVLTGGAAPVLASWLAGQQTDLVPDLVLQGLARFA